MIRTLSLILAFFFVTDTLQEQLISWRDLIDRELPQPDERIHYGPDSLQFGDLWLPEKEPLARVILIYAGCWLDTYPGVEIMNHMANALRDEGFAVWNIEYRRLGHEEDGYPGTFLYVSAGADYLPEVAYQYGLPADNAIVTGHLAGGHLATWLSARKNIDKSSPLYTESPMHLKRYASYGSSPYHPAAKKPLSVLLISKHAEKMPIWTHRYSDCCRSALRISK